MGVRHMQEQLCAQGRRKSEHQKKTQRIRLMGRNRTKEKRKRNVKIRAREKERNIKTHILREQQAESAKMSREKERN